MQVDIGKNIGYLKSGFALVKPNLVSWIIAMVPFLVVIIPLVGPFVMMIFMVNYFAALKEFKASGKVPGIGDILNFDNAVNKILGPFIMGLANMCCVIPGWLLSWTPILIADHAGVGFADALKASFAHTKGNIVPIIVFMICLAIPMIVLMFGLTAVQIVLGFIPLPSIVVLLISLVLMLVALAASLLLGPTVMAAHYLAYDEHRQEIHDAAAAAQVTLP